MPRNSTGTYQLPAGNPVVANTLIETAWANPTMADIGSGLTDSLDRQGRGSMLAALLLVGGTLAAPAMAFSAETTTGIYRPASNVLGFVVSGVEQLRITTAGVSFPNPLRLPDGTLAAPGLSWTNETTMGLYRPGAGAMSLVWGSTPAANLLLLATGNVRAIASLAVGADEFPARLTVDRLAGASVFPAALTSGAVAAFAGSSTAAAAASVSIVSGNTGQGGINFGDTDADGRGRVVYDHSAENLQFTTAGTVGATLTSLNHWLVNGSPDYAYLSVRDAGAYGGSGPNSLRNGLVVESSGGTGLSLLTPNTTASGIAFGDPENNISGQVRYTHSTDQMDLITAGSTRLAITAAAVQGLSPFAAPSGTAAAPGYAFSSAAGNGLLLDETDVVALATGGVARFYVTAGGGLATVNSAVQPQIGGTLGKINVSGSSSVASTTILLSRSGADASGPGLYLGKSRGAVGSYTAVASNDSLGQLAFFGADGTDMDGLCARVRAFTTQAHTPSAAGTAIAIDAVATGATTVTQRLLIQDDVIRLHASNLDGALAVRETGAYGGSGPNASVDGIVLESSGNTGINILTPDANTGQIRFGDTANNVSGGMAYSHATDTLTGIAAGSTGWSLTTSTFVMGSGIEPILNSGTGPTSAVSGGFRGIPINSRSANYTAVLDDAGRAIYHPPADTTARTFTIPSNASVGYPNGSTLTFINDIGAGNITIAITSDTLAFLPGGTTGSRTLTAPGSATAVKVSNTRWTITGTNLS
jgi:hypothetical protein